MTKKRIGGVAAQLRGMRPAHLRGMRPAHLRGMRPAHLRGMRPAPSSLKDTLMLRGKLEF